MGFKHLRKRRTKPWVAGSLAALGLISAAAGLYLLVLEAQHQKAETDAQRTAALLEEAHSLEGRQQPKLAVQFYRMIVKRFPESQEAELARERIEILERARSPRQ